MKIKWRHLFEETTLYRGKEYFERNEIYCFQHSPKRCAAMVLGARAYPVSLEFDAYGVRNMSCNCTQAKMGNRCKHMAALFFELESRGLVGENDPPKLVQLPLKKTEGYQFYDLASNASALTFTETVVKAAQEMINRKDIRLVSVEEGFNLHLGQEEKNCTVEFQLKTTEGRRDNVMLRISRKHLVYASCTAAGCHMYHTPSRYMPASKHQMGCRHVAAAFLVLDDYLQNHQLGDATDYQGQAVLDRFRKKRRSKQVKAAAEMIDALPTAPVRLEPRLEIDYNDTMHLTFKVGAGRLFVVKNLHNLVDCVEQKKQMELGKRDFLHFGTQAFDEASQPYYDLIHKEITMEKLRGSVINAPSGGYYGRSEIKNSIPLYGVRLDSFFDLTKGKAVAFVDKRKAEKKTGMAQVCCGTFHANLSIEKELNRDGEFDGIRVNGMLPHFIDGINHRYIFDDDKLVQIDEEDVELLESMRAKASSSHIDFVVGRKYLTEFFYRILPLIEEQATVNFAAREEVQQYLYPEGKFVFYLDAEDDNVTCLPKVWYGDEGYVFSTNKLESPGRDLLQEQEVLDNVTKFFPHINDDGFLHCDSDEALIFNVLKEGVNALLALGEVQATDQFNRLTIRKKSQISVGVQMESDLLNLSVNSSDMTEEELVDLLQSYRKKKTFHKLKNGDFVPIDDNSMEELSLMLEMMKLPLSDFVQGKMQIPAYRALYLDKLLEKNDTLYATRDRNFKSLIKDFKTVSDSDYEVPDSLQVIMRNYQKFGYKWLRTVESCKFGGILADDMGLGKTLQMIALLLSAKQEERLGTALVITPASLVYNWQAEFEKFAPELKVETITGTKEERKAKLKLCDDTDVLITSYDLLKRDIKAYENLTFTHQVIDEAQYIKTHTTAAAKAVKGIKSSVRFALTGTPIENRLSELWSIFDFLMPGFLYKYDKFKHDFETPIVKNKDDNALQRLKRMVEPFILRRLKGDVLSDLPEKIEEIHYVQFEPEQQRLYDGQAIYMKKILAGQNEQTYQQSKMQILAQITKIRQICCDPSLCFEKYTGASAKRTACLELIQSAIDSEHKVLLFSQFTSLLALMEEDLQAAGITYYKITGDTKKEDRIKMVNQFNGDDTPVFLVSLKAGGTGLNLTGADIVIHFDPWWNVAAQNQATDRAHRIGQTKTVSVYKLIAKNSIEEKILKLQEQKGQLADEVLAGKQGGLMSMSREELLELL